MQLLLLSGTKNSIVLEEWERYLGHLSKLYNVCEKRWMGVCVWDHMHMLTHSCLHMLRYVLCVTLTEKRENPTGNPHHQWHSHAARVLQNSLRRDEYSRSNDRPNDDRDSSEQGHLLPQFHLLLGGYGVGVSIWIERVFLSKITWSWIPVGMGNWHSPSGHLVRSLTNTHTLTLPVALAHKRPEWKVFSQQTSDTLWQV